MNRRDFLATSALTLGTTTACATGAGTATLPATLSTKPRSGILKIGLVGCGGRGTGAAVQALRADPNVVFWAIGDTFLDRVEGSLKGITETLGKDGSSKIDCPPQRRFVGFEAYKQVIDSGVDVVLLVTPPGFRPPQFEYAVAAGKHVFLEKPVAVDAAGLRRIRAAADLAKQKDLSVVCGFCWRFDTRMRAVFGQIHDGAIGDIVSVHTTYHTGTLSPKARKPEWSDMEWQMRNWWHFTWLSGDHIVEQAIHSIDRLLWATNGKLPVRCIALGGRAARDSKGQPEQGHVYDHFAVIYEYADGKRTFHTCRQIDACPNDNTDYVYGTKGHAAINGWAPPHQLVDASGKAFWASGKEAKDMYQQEHDELFAGLRSGKVLWTGDAMCDSTMMAIMARMAAYTGQTVTWEQAWKSTEDLVPKQLAFGPIPVPAVAIPGVTKLA